MQRERISDNVYWFQSEVYAQVTAGVVAGPQWAVVIDTLAIPEESIDLRTFIEEELRIPVRYVINTHHHADHTWGNCFFPGATMISHSLCREYTITRETESLESAKKNNPTFKPVKLIPQHITFSEGELKLRVGKKHLTIFNTPGNSMDGISILVDEDKVLFAGDVFMPIPFIVGGDIDLLIDSITRIGQMGLENIVQGHGDIVLRGEIESTVEDNIGYLSALKRSVKTAMRRKDPLEALEKIDVETCGKSRVLLGGLAEDLHKKNVAALYRSLLDKEKKNA